PERYPGVLVLAMGAQPDAIYLAVSPRGLVGAVGALKLVVGHGVRAIGEHIQAELDQPTGLHFAECDGRILVLIQVAARVTVVVPAARAADRDHAVAGHPLQDGAEAVRWVGVAVDAG